MQAPCCSKNKMGSFRAPQPPPGIQTPTFWFVQGDGDGEWLAAQPWQVRLFEMDANLGNNMEYGANVAIHGGYIYAFYHQSASEGPILLNLFTGMLRKVACYTPEYEGSCFRDTGEAQRVKAALLNSGIHIDNLPVL